MGARGSIAGSEGGRGALHAILPADVDDPALVSGGNVYDRRVLDGVRALGREVREHHVEGTWPRPGPTDLGRLDRALSEVPIGAAVLADGLVVCGAADVVAPHTRRLRLVVLVHLAVGEGAPDLAPGERSLLEAACGVVVTSAWSRRRLLGRYALDPERVEVVVPGVDPAAPTVPSEPGGRLLVLGAVTPPKGQDLLVRALSRAREVAPPGWRATLAGPVRRDPAFVERVRELVDRHDLTAHVGIPGPVDGAAALADTDLLVLPSWIETYGMVAAEALARRVPVLATAAGGVVDVVRGAGTLVPPGDTDALEVELRRWWSRAQVRRERRAAAAAPAWRAESWELAARRLDRAMLALTG